MNLCWDRATLPHSRCIVGNMQTIFPKPRKEKLSDTISLLLQDMRMLEKEAQHAGSTVLHPLRVGLSAGLVSAHHTPWVGLLDTRQSKYGVLFVLLALWHLLQRSLHSQSPSKVSVSLGIYESSSPLTIHWEIPWKNWSAYLWLY